VSSPGPAAPHEPPPATRPFGEPGPDEPTAPPPGAPGPQPPSQPGPPPQHSGQGQGGQNQGGQYPGGQYPGGQYQGGQYPGGQYDRGQFRHRFAPPPVAAPARPSIPPWLWPLLAVSGLVLGLVGGLLGGALVLGTRDGAGSDLQVGGAAPLAADNGSIVAVAKKVLPSTVQVRVVNGSGEDATGATGSGIIVDNRGHVITNNHVVENGEDATIVVVDVSGRSHRATVVGRSPVYDIAVLEISRPRGLQPAALGSSRRMRVGEAVVAIGSPLGLSATVTSGIVSAVNRPVTTGTGDGSSYINAVQTDAAINPGNSGGPLVNMRGQVVGVNSAIATTGGGVFGGESGNIGVGFAIPMEQVEITAEQILDTGRAEYPVIGADVATDRSVDGARIMSVPEGTPAARAGLREGDRVVAVDGKRVTDGISLIVAIRSHRPGQTVELVVVRGGDRRTVEVRLDAKVG
jgi:putative serine protease PepD